MIIGMIVKFTISEVKRHFNFNIKWNVTVTPWTDQTRTVNIVPRFEEK